MSLTLHAPFDPAGDQPAAIDTLTAALTGDDGVAVLEGATGTGKTFTVANVIEQVGRPTLVLAHNKTLAQQLADELTVLFPDAAVCFFVSYYDYYQPEAYNPTTDTYIAKDALTNPEIERLRHETTASLLSRDDVIVVASVSAIYALGPPEQYANTAVNVHAGQQVTPQQLARQLVAAQYTRNDIDSAPGTFRIRGDTAEVVPVAGPALRIELFGDEVDQLTWFDPVTRDRGDTVEAAAVYPSAHYLADMGAVAAACEQIAADLDTQAAAFDAADQPLEAARLRERVGHDLEMLRETGRCPSMESYSRYFDGRAPGQRPWCLLDFFGDDYLVVVDESHMTLPQIRSARAGDRSRKQTLVDHGFRLPSVQDNRPLTFDEFIGLSPRLLCVSATPADWELDHADVHAEQVIRPTGVPDPAIEVVPTDGQVDDLLGRVNAQVEAGNRTLVTALTQVMAEQLADFLTDNGVAAGWMHAQLDTPERSRQLARLRDGDIDVLVGVNLLREGLDLPEVALVAIMGADVQGFLRSGPALIQTCGRAARHPDGHVVMYADRTSDAMQGAIDVTGARRQTQLAYNAEHGIVPKATERTSGRFTSRFGDVADERDEPDVDPFLDALGDAELEAQMQQAADAMQFEQAARIRDLLATRQG